MKLFNTRTHLSIFRALSLKKSGGIARTVRISTLKSDLIDVFDNLRYTWDLALLECGFGFKEHQPALKKCGKVYLYAAKLFFLMSVYET